MILFLALSGCHGKLDPVPADIEGLCAFLFENQEEPEVLAEGLVSLQTWIDTRGEAEEGYNLPALTDADVVDVEHPGRTLTDALGGVADAESPHPLDAHVAFILLPDQSVVNPGDYGHFDRSFLLGGDCFADRGCERVETWNDVLKTAAFGVEIPYEYGKDYQWVDYRSAEGDARTAVVSRGWVPEVAFDEGGENGILQSFTLDVFLGTREGGVRRVQAQWSEMKLVIDEFVTDDFLRGELIDGLQGVFADTDEAITDLGL